jgi:flagellar biogenesis protein FliO
VENGIRYWSLGGGCFSVSDYAFSTPNLRKEEKMDFVIGLLVVILLVFAIVWLVQRT